jgi:hypothetical protein
MGDFLSVKSLLHKNCTVSSQIKKCQFTTHFCRCSTDKEEIIPTAFSCLAGPQVPSQEKCSELYPPPPAPTCAPPPSQVECATPEPQPEAPTCAPCTSEETVSFNSPTTKTLKSSAVIKPFPTFATNTSSNETVASGDDKRDFMGQFVDRFMKEKKDLLILILGVFNIVQCSIIVICEICRACDGGDKKAVQDPERDSSDSFAMDKRATCDANEYMVPMVELNTGNFEQINAEVQYEQAQVIEIQQQNKNSEYF